MSIVATAYSQQLDGKQCVRDLDRQIRISTSRGTVSETTVSRGRSIVSRDFQGSYFKDNADSDSWGKERVELAISENLKGKEKNLLHGVGDPSYATVDGKIYLYFIYLKRNNNGLLDFNIGYVKER